MDASSESTRSRHPHPPPFPPFSPDRMGPFGRQCGLRGSLGTLNGRTGVAALVALAKCQILCKGAYLEKGSELRLIVTRHVVDHSREQLIPQLPPYKCKAHPSA